MNGSWQSTSTNSGNWRQGQRVFVEWRYFQGNGPIGPVAGSDEFERRLKRAYRLAAKRWHPDLGGDDLMMKRVNQAFESQDLTALEAFAD